MSTSSPRLNALTHGLSANTPITEQEQSAYESSVQTWIHELGPTCEAESALIRRAALADLRPQRCAKAEEAALAHNAHEALRILQARRRKLARKLAQSLPATPAATLDRLRSIPEGCDWLIARWTEIDDTLAQGHPLSHDQLDRVQLLSGLHPRRPGPDSPPEIIEVWWMLLPLLPSPFIDPYGRDLRQQAVEAGLSPPSNMPATFTELRRAVRAYIRGHLDALAEARTKALASTSAQRAAEESAALASSQIDTSPSAQLRHRYESEAARSLQQSLSLLLRIRQDRRRAQAHELRLSRHPSTAAPGLSSAFPISRNEPPPPDPSNAATPHETNDLRIPSPTPEPPSPQRTASAPDTPSPTSEPVHLPLSGPEPLPTPPAKAG